MREKLGLRNIIEPDSREKRLIDSHKLDDYFIVNAFNFIVEKQNVATENPSSAIICKDLELFIQHVVDSRNIYDFHLSFGVDGGGKSLKFTLSIQLRNQSSEVKEKWKDTGVKKIFIIALAPNIQENYHNVFSIWSQLQI